MILKWASLTCLLNVVANCLMGALVPKCVLMRKRDMFVMDELMGNGALQMSIYYQQEGTHLSLY